MKRTTLLVSLFLATVAFTNAQTNLVSNPGFETWGETLPDPWYILSASVTGVTPAPSTTEIAEGAQSLKLMLRSKRNFQHGTGYHHYTRPQL